jgi:hypothetical protein
MAGVVDADTHIAESEAMWNFIDREMYPRWPILAKIPDDTWYKERNAFRLIDGEIFPKPAGKASFSLITPSAQKKESGRGDMREIFCPQWWRRFFATMRERYTGFVSRKF